jgi:hypothetical protein
MQLMLIALLTLFLGACATMQSQSPAVSILLDLDPSSADRTVIVESIAADKEGRLYLPERVTGNILRVDPKAPKSVAVGRIEAREIKGKKVDASPSGIAFNQAGDLFVAVGPFSEVVRIRGADLNPAKPGSAQTFATGTAGANGIAFDRHGNLFISGGASGIVYRVGPNGGAAQPAIQIEKHSRTLPDGKTQQAIVANGLEFDAKGCFMLPTRRAAQFGKLQSTLMAKAASLHYWRRAHCSKARTDSPLTAAANFGSWRTSAMPS